MENSRKLHEKTIELSNLLSRFDTKNIIFDYLPYSIFADNLLDGFVFNPSLRYMINHESGNPIPDIRWCNGDNSSNYLRCLEKYGDSWRYKDKPVIYNINDYGYRAPKFSTVKWKKSIPVFGCSQVFGVGNSEDELFTTLLQQTTNRQVINFGYPSGSNEIILRNIIALTKFVAPEDFPEYVVIGWTFADRTIHYDLDTELHLGAWTPNTKPNKININNYYCERNMSVYNGLLKTYYIIQAVRAILKDKCKLIEYTTWHQPFWNCKILSRNIKTEKEKARDDVHPGHLWHREVHDYIFGEIV
jgi:hypothetical protein